MRKQIKKISYMTNTANTEHRKGLPCLYVEDKQRIDYEKLYYRVEHLHPELSHIVQYIHNVTPSYIGEYKELLTRAVQFPEQKNMVRQRMFDISLRFVLKSAVYYYEVFKINIEDIFQTCCEVMLQTIDNFITNHNTNSATFHSFYNLKAMNEIIIQFFRVAPNGTTIPKRNGYVYAQFLQRILAILGTKHISEWQKEDIKQYFKEHNILCYGYYVPVEETANACYNTLELTEEINDSIIQIENKSYKTGITGLKESIPPYIFQQLKNKEKYLLIRAFFFTEDKPPTLEKIGQEIGLSKERTRQLISHTIRKIKKYIHKYRYKKFLQYTQ